MERVCERLKLAIQKKEKIIIYGDFDSDGVAATAVLVHLFRDLGGNVSWYIPDRFGEGHGISQKGVEWILNEKGNVVITVDCGIANKNEVEELAKYEIDIIITDHHYPDKEFLPKRCYILHPALGGYPFQLLSGAGMAFKLAQGLLKYMGLPPESCCNYIDLAAIGIVADVVPLLGENRIIVKEGLKKMETDLRPPLQALLSASIGIEERVNDRTGNKNGVENKIERGTKKGGSRNSFWNKDKSSFLNKDKSSFRNKDKSSWTARDIAFLVAPRINAAGRMEKASWALSLLLEEDCNLMTFHAERLERLNRERQEIEAKILIEIYQIIRKDDILRIEKRGLDKNLPDKNPFSSEPVLFLYSPHWHFGVIGIAASRLAKEYNVPVFLACNVDGQIRGSARSCKGFSIVKALDACSKSLLRHGGHEEAGGFTLNPENLPQFREELLEYAKSNFISLFPNISKVLPLELSHTDHALAKEIALLAPFGQGNPVPTFLSSQIILHQQRLVGKEKNHLLLSLYQDGTIRKGLAFNWEGDFPLLPGRYDIEYELAVDEWQKEYNTNLQQMQHIQSGEPVQLMQPMQQEQLLQQAQQDQPVVLYLSNLNIANISSEQKFQPKDFSKVVVWTSKKINDTTSVSSKLAAKYFFVDQRFLKSKSKYIQNLFSKNNTLILVENPDHLICFLETVNAPTPINTSINISINISMPVYKKERAFHHLLEEDIPYPKLEKVNIKEGDFCGEHLLLWFMPTDWDETCKILEKGQRDCAVKVHLLFSEEHLNEKRALVKGTPKEETLHQLEKLFFKDRVLRKDDILRTGGDWFDKVR